MSWKKNNSSSSSSSSTTKFTDSEIDFIERIVGLDNFEAAVMKTSFRRVRLAAAKETTTTNNEEGNITNNDDHVNCDDDIEGIVGLNLYRRILLLQRLEDVVSSSPPREVVFDGKYQSVEAVPKLSYRFLPPDPPLPSSTTASGRLLLPLPDNNSVHNFHHRWELHVKKTIRNSKELMNMKKSNTVLLFRQGEVLIAQPQLQQQ